MYLKLMQEGWRLHEIDEMDIHYFFDLMNFSTQEDKQPTTMKKAKQHGFIDQVAW